MVIPSHARKFEMVKIKIKKEKKKGRHPTKCANVIQFALQLVIFFYLQSATSYTLAYLVKQSTRLNM